MGKKKGKKTDEPEEEDAGEREFSHNYEEGGEASADAPQPAAATVDVSDTPAPSGDAKPSGSGGDATMDLSDTLVVRGTSETRHVKSVPYCEGARSRPRVYSRALRPPSARPPRPATLPGLRRTTTLHVECVLDVLEPTCIMPVLPCAVRAVRAATVCSMPFEFCEWNPLFKKCKENFEKNWRKHYPEVDESEESLAELMAQLGFSGGDSASKKAQSSKKAAAADGEGAAQPTSKKDKKAKEPSEIVIELNNRNKKKHITIVKGLEAFGVDTAAAAKVFGKRFACGSALKKGQNGQPDQIEIQGSCRDELPAVLVDKLKMSLDDIVLLIDSKKVKASEVAAK